MNISSYCYRAVVAFFCGAALSHSGPSLLAQSAYSSPYTFTTLAGLEIRFTGGYGYEDGPGPTAKFRNPYGVATDGRGNVYVADTFNHCIRKITSAGIVTTFAGSGGGAGDADGAASVARFYLPYGVAAAADGGVFVADTGNATIRKISPTGVVTTVAGKAGAFGSIDGIGSEARFGLRYGGPYGVAVDKQGNVFVADTSNHTIRKITPLGNVSTVAGLAGEIGSTDGVGSAARFNRPQGVAVDDNGILFVADTYNNTVRKITNAGVVSTLAGLAGVFGSADGTGGAAKFGITTSVAVDGGGNVFVADPNNHTLRRIAPDGKVTTIGGLVGASGFVNGTGSAARFGDSVYGGPDGVAVEQSGNLYVADSQTDSIRKGVPALVSESAGRLINLSVRKSIGPDSLAVGFVLKGAGTKPMLVRAVGPGLEQFGVSNVLATPALTLVRGGIGGGIIATNSGWGGGAALATAFARVGAFPLQSASADAAVLPIVGAADFSAQVSGPRGVEGNVLVEVYDAETANVGVRLANVSVLANTGAGGNLLTAGFVVGTGVTMVLIRAVGPGLVQFGVPSVLTAPALRVFRGDTQIGAIFGWNDAPELREAFGKVGAFALPAGSVDAVMLLTLDPGNYSAQVSGQGGTSGAVLLEIYEVPPQ